METARAGWHWSRPPHRPAKGAPSLEERALLLRLKEVTDKQRDELRAHSRDLRQRSQETEAVRAGTGSSGGGALLGSAPPTSSPWFRPQLQEQLQRLLLVNAELRHKLAAVQAQLRAAQDREREHELPREGARERAEGEKQQPNPASPEDLVGARGRQDPSFSEPGSCWARALGPVCSVVQRVREKSEDCTRDLCPHLSPRSLHTALSSAVLVSPCSLLGTFPSIPVMVSPGGRPGAARSPG